MRSVVRLFLACGFLYAAGSVAAQDSADIAMAWGLLGTWAVNCDEPADRANAHLSFVRAGERLVHRRDFGDHRDEFPVVTVQAKPGDQLEVVIDLGSVGGERTIIFAKAGEGKKRAISNRGADGTYTIRNGKFAANKAPVPVQTRCAAMTN